MVARVYCLVDRRSELLKRRDVKLNFLYRKGEGVRERCSFAVHDSVGRPDDEALHFLGVDVDL